MTQELREKILSAWGAPEHDDIMPKRADAAIAIIRGETLEEAAKVAAAESVRPGYTTNEHMMAHRIAAAIRALKEGK